MNANRPTAVVFSALNVAEAEYVVSLLRAEGIWCDSPASNMAILCIGFTGPSVDVIVFEEDLDRAREILKHREDNGEDDGEDAPDNNS